MIDNMIMKSIVSNVIGKKLEEMWNSIEANAEKRGATSKAEIERQQKAASDYDSAIEYYENLLDINDNNPLADVHMSREEIVAMIEKYKKEREKALANLSAAEQSYSDAIAPTPTDVEGIRNTVDGMKSGVEEEFKAWTEAFGISFGDRGDKNLSNLQQGIQGITEDTAGALEAITNGISQQSYLQSDLLTQIRDAVVSMDVDVSLGVMSQILLQLQSSYQIQQSMLLTMENWTNPSGNAVRVELIS
jgi:tetratricopeptide (TPR) repeat protein